MGYPIGIIFDMDGVLVDSADAHRRAWQRLGEEAGKPFTAELFQQTFGQRNASIIPTWLGHEVTPAEIERLGDRKEELYRDLVREGAVQIYRTIPERFGELHERGAGVAIASSGPRANIELLIEVMGAIGMIDVVVSAEDVAHGKPHPEGFLKAAERLGLAAGECAVIEDSVHGIEAAKRAAMLAVAVLTSTPRATLLAAGADLLAGEVADLDLAAVLARLRAA